MRKCIVAIVCALIIACASLLINSGQQKRTVAEVEDKNVSILASNVEFTTSALQSVAKTLLLYREDLTETELALFEQSLAKDQLQLNQLEANFHFIADVQEVDYTQSILQDTQSLLGDIMTATNITKAQMNEISHSFSVQSKEIAGLPKSQQGLNQYIDIVVNLNKRIEAFVKN